MTSNLTYWYAGQPVVIHQNATQDMSTWYGGQPYVMYEYYQAPATDTTDMFGFAATTGVQNDVFGIM